MSLYNQSFQSDVELFILHSRLSTLERSLAYERMGSSIPTPSHRSLPSGTTSTMQTQAHCPATRLEKLLLRQQYDETRTREGATRPSRQFEAQVEDQIRRGWDSIPPQNWELRFLRGDFKQYARAAVKERWVEQGIWDEEWEEGEIGELWKHERPIMLDLEPEWEEQSELEQPSKKKALLGLSTMWSEWARSRTAKKRDIEDQQRYEKQQDLYERMCGPEREASRPYHQFFYQVSMERKIIQQDLDDDDDSADMADINTKAYENVKKVWMNQWIWDEKWSILPGMTWKHEDPDDEEAADVTLNNTKNSDESEVRGTEEDNPRVDYPNLSTLPDQVDPVQGQEGNRSSSSVLVNSFLEQQQLHKQRRNCPLPRTSTEHIFAEFLNDENDSSPIVFSLPGFDLSRDRFPIKIAQFPERNKTKWFPRTERHKRYRTVNGVLWEQVMKKPSDRKWFKIWLRTLHNSLLASSPTPFDLPSHSQTIKAKEVSQSTPWPSVQPPISVILPSYHGSPSTGTTKHATSCKRRGLFGSCKRL